LLVRGDALLVLDLSLYCLDGVSALHLKGDGLAGQGLHKDLHASTQSQDKVQGGFLLDVVVLQGAPILELLAREDESLLVRGDALLVLDLSLYCLDGVSALHLKGDGLAGQGLHKDLHASTQSQHKVKSGFLLDVVVLQCSAVLKLLAREDETLLVRRDALLILNLRLHRLNRVGALNL